MPKKLDTASFYRRIFRDAWEITWHHKQLWIFGFFATLIGFGGVFEVFFSTLEQASQTLPFAAAHDTLGALIPGHAAVQAVISYSAFPSLTLAIFAVLALLLTAIFVWMCTVSVGALVADVRKIYRGGEPAFGDGVKAGTDMFWPVFKVNLAVKLVVLAALVMTALNLQALLRYESMGSGIIYIGTYVALAAISFIASLVAVFASIEVVAHRAKPVDALQNAFDLVWKNWLVMFETAVLLALASVALALAAALFVLVLSVPLIFLIAVMSSVQAAGAVYGLIALTAALLIVGAACVGSMVSVLTVSVWTLLWNEIADRTPGALLHRLMHKLRTRKKR